jgi:hypothetical protein
VGKRGGYPVRAAQGQQRRKADQQRDHEHEAERGENQRLVHQVDLDNPALQMAGGGLVQPLAGLPVPCGSPLS